MKYSFLKRGAAILEDNNYEHLLFIKELGRLLEDYHKCLDARIQKDIYKDIELLGKVIYS